MLWIFGLGASVIWIKVDFRGLASVGFIFGDTTGFQERRLLPGGTLAATCDCGCGTLRSRLI